ncbi:MAG: hypothetical protein KGY66_07720 [Candidatus Thermoplasmatota archaeon]|nr:hypothetical protein [Candidatus Thermoplasmatota archaeon]MBS3790786.1 hypothetical protein [Candidatus Thermoplasmatota archaeon]
MPLLSSFQAAVGGVLVILVFGIVVEKHYVSRSTVFYNLLSFILLLASIEISYLLLSGLVIYLVLGAVVMKLELKPLFPAFGARTYGSLALVLLLEGRKFIPGIEGRGVYETFGLLILLWILVTGLVHLLGHLYKKHGWKIF